MNETGNAARTVTIALPNASEMIERVARAIAKRHGDDFDAIATDKPDWTANRGYFGGRFRDVNEPYRSDYEDMAEAAIEAMREPTDEMYVAATRITRDPGYGHCADVVGGAVYRAMIDSALKVQA